MSGCMGEFWSLKAVHKKWLISWVFWLGILFFYLPIILVVVYSFNEFRYPLWKGFSLKWYEAVLHNEQLIKSLVTSLEIASFSSFLAVLSGTTCALALANERTIFERAPKKRTFLRLLSGIPLLVPDTVMGMSLFLLFVNISKKFLFFEKWGFAWVSIAHGVMGFSYVLYIVQSRLATVEKNLEEAALDLGASPLKVFFLITLPLIWPSLVAGFLLSFVLSLDDVILTSFTAGPHQETLSLVLFSSLKLGLTPEINALGSLLILMVSILTITAAYILRKWKLIGVRSSSKEKL